MITQVDRNGNWIVQKVTQFRKKETKVHYQVVELPAGDSSRIHEYPTLQAARAFIGKTNGGKTVH